MPAQKKNIEPALQLGDKVVQIGPADWTGFRNVVKVMDDIGARDIVSELDLTPIRDAVPSIQKTAVAEGAIAIGDILGAIVATAAANVSALFDFFIKHPPLVEATVLATTNLTADDFGKLTAGEMLRTFRAAFNQLEADGVFAEIIAFFADRLGLKAGAAAPPVPSEPKPEQSTASPAAA